MAWNNLAGVGKLLATLGQLQGVGQWQQKGASKGKGAHKGSGKAKGKGKSHGKGTDNELRCFQCLWDDCKAATSHKATWDSGCCHSCERPKGIAKSPPLERLTSWAYEARRKDKAGSNDACTEKSLGGKNKDATSSAPRTAAAVVETERLAELRADRLAGLKQSSGDSSAGSQPSQSAGQVNHPGKKVGSFLCESALESAPLLLELIKPILALVAADWTTEQPTDLDPDKGLKAILQASNHLVVADGREALETSIAEGEKTLTQISSPTLKKSIQERIDADKTALAKCSKKAAPSLATQLAALQEAEKALLTQASERRDKEDLGKKKAAARSTERGDFFAEIKNQLSIIEQAVESHEANWSASHAAKSQTLDCHEKIMLARLQEKIVAAEPDGTTTADTAETKSAETATKEAVAARKTAEATAADAATQHAELLRKFEVLQRQAGKAEELQKQALALQQAELVFTLADASMIPEEVAPKTGEKAFWKICGHLFQLMEKLHMGGNIAVSLAKLNQHSLAKNETQSLMKKLLGAELWTGWFGAADFMMVEDSVLPRQLLTYLHLALRQLKEHYHAVEEARTAASQAYVLLAEANAKKRKVAQ